ncbi:MAG: hypothetical protein K2X74_23140, partial [Acetobacteraceae bacterium]|nr:hypothetical protein [Acetobacteraceae bacterium]
AQGEARLRRGQGVIARWTVPAPEWEVFRAFAARRAAAGPGLADDVAPAPATGPEVEIRFGRRQVLVHDSYHPLRRFGLPELGWVGWQQPADAPEALEFGVRYPRGESGTVGVVVRVPVPRAAREDGIRIYHHFAALAPKPRVGLAFRRPGLVLGSSLGVTVLGAAVGGVAWHLRGPGDAGDAAMVALAVGLVLGLTGGVVTAIVGLVVLADRRRGGG